MKPCADFSPSGLFRQENSNTDTQTDDKPLFQNIEGPPECNMAPKAIETRHDDKHDTIADGKQHRQNERLKVPLLLRLSIKDFEVEIKNACRGNREQYIAQRT
jgi:hypothetical protein